MWDLIIARLDPRRGTISSLIGLSSLGHLLFLMFVLLRYGQSTLTVSLKRGDRRILMMRTISKRSSAPLGARAGSRVRSGAAVVQPSMPAPAKKTQQKLSSQAAKAKAPVAQKASRHKQLAQRSKKKSEETKQKKKELLKEISSPTPAPSKTASKVEEKIITPREKVIEKVQEPYVVTMGDGVVADDMLGDGEQHEYDTIDEIRSAICATWTPPKGVRVKESCTIKATINDCGIAIMTKVVTSSRNAAFDMAARQALTRAKYPLTLWRRELIVEFS